MVSQEEGIQCLVGFQFPTLRHFAAPVMPTLGMSRSISIPVFCTTE